MPTRIATTAIPYSELSVAEGNFDRSRSPISLIIIHTMVGTWQGAAARFAQTGQQASAHYGVKMDGGLVHWLEEYWTAYHAGDYPVNQRSIGIEHEDGGKYNDPRPDALYATSAKLVADICRFYGFPADSAHIKPHREVSDKPTACPDALDVDRIIREAAALLKPTPTPPPPVTPPAVDTDESRGLQVLKSYRSARPQGPEGNFEGYANALVASDRRVYELSQQPPAPQPTPTPPTSEQTISEALAALVSAIRRSV